MTIKCNYNIELVQQFYATLVFGQGPNIPMTWMTRDRQCHSDFVHFAELMGYPFRGAGFPQGERMHRHIVDKKTMAPLYDISTFTPGNQTGLGLLYNILLRIFRSNIAPQAGNEDEIRGALVNLLVYAHKIHTGEENRPVDVMDFIYQEMYECIHARLINLRSL